MNPEKLENNEEELPMIEMPENFQAYYGFDESIGKSGLAKAYQEVFAAPPWNEKWSEEDVLEKLKRETDHPGSVTVLMKGRDRSVQGFSWGRLLETKDLESEATPALGKKPEGLWDHVSKHAGERLFYFHEIAILPQARAGVDPIRFLIRPGLKLANQDGVHQDLFWSTPESKIVRIALLFGYEQVFGCSDSHEHPIVFMNHPDNREFLNALEHADQRDLARLARPH